MLKTFFLKVTVFDPRNSSSHPVLVRDVIIYVFQKSTCNNPLLHVQRIWQIFHFRSTVISEECLQRQILSGPSVFQEATSSFYLGYCVSLKQTLALILLSKEWINLTHDLQPSIPWKSFILLQNSHVAIHSFKFTMFFQNESFSMGVL